MMLSLEFFTTRGMTLKRVHGPVLEVCHYLQICWIVIRFIVVTMMNNLVVREWPPKHLFGNHNMLQYVPLTSSWVVRHSEPHVARRMRRKPSLPPGRCGAGAGLCPTRMRTELICLIATSRWEGGAAGVAVSRWTRLLRPKRATFGRTVFQRGPRTLLTTGRAEGGLTHRIAVAGSRAILIGLAGVSRTIKSLPALLADVGIQFVIGRGTVLSSHCVNLLDRFRVWSGLGDVSALLRPIFIVPQAV